MPRNDLTRRILARAKAHPGATNGEIARAVGCSHQNVSQTLTRYGLGQRGDVLDLDATISADNIAWLRRESARLGVGYAVLLNAMITDARVDAKEAGHDR